MNFWHKLWMFAITLTLIALISNTIAHRMGTHGGWNHEEDCRSMASDIVPVGR